VMSGNAAGKVREPGMDGIFITKHFRLGSPAKLDISFLEHNNRTRRYHDRGCEVISRGSEQFWTDATPRKFLDFRLEWIPARRVFSTGYSVAMATHKTTSPHGWLAHDWAGPQHLQSESCS
jgi:hypothetical protein